MSGVCALVHTFMVRPRVMLGAAQSRECELDDRVARLAWRAPGAGPRCRSLAARGESLAAFDERCIPASGVAPPSNTPGILSRRALPAGRLARLGATPDFHHGLLVPDTGVRHSSDRCRRHDRGSLRARDPGDRRGATRCRVRGGNSRAPGAHVSKAGDFAAVRRDSESGVVRVPCGCRKTPSNAD
jgi:hypothetical protein